MIVSLHVATGAAGGAIARTRGRAVLLGLALHLAGDLVPHQDIRSRRFEIASGVAGVLGLALRRGPLDAATVGSLAASCPDVEHLFPLPRPGGSKLFPTHRFHGWHKTGGLPAWAQVLAAGVLLGAVAARKSSS